MIGNGSIDFSLSNIWKSWFLFRKGKRKTKELESFQYHLEENLWRLYVDLNNGKYHHGGYRHFTIKEKKRRDIAVASIRDRGCHRLVYEYLVSVFDKTFIYDAWSCRKNKGVVGAIERTELFLRKYPKSFVWRADISKFFDNVDQSALMGIISRKIKDKNAIWLIENIIRSYSNDESKQTGRRGIPIGNLTSQVFANIYLNEFDRFVKYELKPQFYLRYGDDFIVGAGMRAETEEYRRKSVEFLANSLKMEINRKNDIIVPCNSGLLFLGMEIYPTGRRLKKGIWQSIDEKLELENTASYSGLVSHHDRKKMNLLNWMIFNKIAFALRSYGE
jgi:RNA-directed DNA polymerase